MQITEIDRNQPLPLGQVKSNGKLQIISITGGRQVQARLATLGIFPHSQIQILQKSGCGPLLIIAKGCRLALDKELADNILVVNCRQEKVVDIYSDEVPKMPWLRFLFKGRMVKELRLR